MRLGARSMVNRGTEHTGGDKEAVAVHLFLVTVSFPRPSKEAEADLKIKGGMLGQAPQA